MVDTCTFCKKKQICNPTELYFGYCGWREGGAQDVPIDDIKKNKDSKTK